MSLLERTSIMPPVVTHVSLRRAPIVKLDERCGNDEINRAQHNEQQKQR